MTAGDATLPLGFESWPPLLQAGSLGLLTFAQEDLPTVSAALLASAGVLSWQTGFWGCFLGIWIGDMLLYLGARAAGGKIEQTRWFRRFAKPGALEASKAWFERHGTGVLVASRFIPGSRFAAYTTAGVLRLPFARFAAVTGLAVAMWTGGLFLAALHFAEPLLNWLKAHGSSAAALGALASAWLLWRVFGPLLRGNASTEGRTKPAFSARLGAWGQRWRQWEFWPAWLFYLPVGAYYVWLSLRHGGLATPSFANPGIPTGGLVGESKLEIMRELSAAAPRQTAAAFLIEGCSTEERAASVERILREKILAPPFILKPDAGQRGAGVKLIRNAQDWRAILEQTRAPLMMQEYAPGPCEIGVFYYRRPFEPHGKIFAITEKIFPELTGDGRSTVEALIWSDPRARCLAGRYLERFAARRNEVLAQGARLKLVEAGNHAQGCIFRDGIRFATPELEARIDEISRSVPGFLIGRYDLRFASEEALRRGQFQIVELNGAAAEATSIYDARNSLCSAYRTLFAQWRLVFEIGAANRRNGARGSSATEIFRAWLAYRKLAATYPSTD